MRKQTRESLATLAQQVSSLRTISSAHAFNLEAAERSVTALTAAVDAIQPARIDMTQELADDITRKLHGPLTISEDASKWMQRLSPHGNTLVTAPFGYGPESGSLWLEIKPDGTFHQIIKDQYGTYMWQGTFSPPSWQKEQHGNRD